MMAKKTARRRPAPVVTQRKGPSLAVIIGAVVVLLFAGIVAFGIYRTQQQNETLNAPPAGVVADGLIVGSPARLIRPLTDQEKRALRLSAGHYAEKAAGYAASSQVV